MVPTARSPREGASPQMQHVRPRHNWPKESHPSTSCYFTPQAETNEESRQTDTTPPPEQSPVRRTPRDDLTRPQQRRGAGLQLQR